jgi:DNA-binding Lrp family transcriptional regulator
MTRGASSHAPKVQIREMSVKPIFVQLQCEPGKTYDVADAIYKTELVSELYSTSGEYDLLLKIYLPQEEDIGKFINQNIVNIPGIVRSLTTLTFTAF